MIRYSRPTEPVGFSQSTKTCRKHLKDLVAAGTELKGEDFNRNVWAPHKDAFNLAQRNKCAYCERLHTGYGDVEHVLPKTKVAVLGQDGEEQNTLKVKGRRASTEVKPGYWWRAYEWANYVFACNHCNSKWKLNYLTVDPPHTALDQPKEERAETVLLVHPYDDVPSTHLRVDPYGVMYGLTPKGAATIRDLGLNRPSLVQHRLYAYEEAMHAANSGDIPAIETQVREERSFALARWWAVQDVLAPA
ncbi:MAG: hypothetical protein KUG77_28925 [Nannocystaceae bacterium]|nr:hypothetical protein [Nannocystaceae bacterium]